MKTLRIFGLMAMLCFIMPAFVSCDKDDDDDDINASDIYGKYSGTLGWKVGNVEDNFSGDFEVSIEKDLTDDDDVIVTLPECTFAPPIPNSRPFTIPAVRIDDVDVDLVGNVYTLSEDKFSVDINGVPSPGSLTGTIKGNKAVINYTITPGVMPMPINFTFTGTIK